MDPAQRHAGFKALGLAGIQPPPRPLNSATARRLLRRVFNELQDFTIYFKSNMSINQ